MKGSWMNFDREEGRMEGRESDGMTKHMENGPLILVEVSVRGMHSRRERMNPMGKA